MKKILLVILLILMLVVSMVPAFAADFPSNSAINTSVKAEIVSENPGILPTNPFYFLKEWSRGIRRVLTFSALSKANYELNVADEKIAELVKIDEIGFEGSAALQTSLVNYNDNLVRLKLSLQSLKDVTNNSDVDRLFVNLIAKTNRHQIILGDLKSRHEDLSESFATSEDLIQEILKQVPSSYFYSKSESSGILRFLSK